MTAAHDRNAQAGAWQVETRPVPAAGHGGAFGALKTLWGRIADPIARAFQYRRTFAELASLDDRTLADLGISRSDIPAIASGSFVRDSETNYLRGRVVGYVANQNDNRHIAA
jgi:uncharacterized protein YjiS (DUF1127 family)